MDWGSVADWVVASMTGAVAFIAWRQLPLIGDQVNALSEQIRLTREIDQAQAERTRVWRTTDACMRIDHDPIFETASKRIWEASEGGMKYEKGKIDKRDVIIVLNHLEVVALGVRQGLYDKDIVKDHLELSIIKAVEKLIRNNILDEKLEGYERLEELYNEWKKPPDPKFPPRQS